MSSVRTPNNWQPYVAKEEWWDWKDFRMSICRTHTWFGEDESLYEVMGSFEAWREPQVYCIKDYKPAGYKNTVDNIYGYKVEIEDGLSGRDVETFAHYNQALEFVRTTSIQHCKCQVVVFKIYHVDYYPKKIFKLKYTLTARKKTVSIIDTETEEEVKPEDPVAHPKLRSISGGKDNTGNWLLGLPVDTVFLSISKKNAEEFILAQFHVMHKWTMGVHLHSNFPPQQTGDFFVHSLRFSQMNTLVDIQQLGEEDDIRGEGSGTGDEV